MTSSTKYSIWYKDFKMVEPTDIEKKSLEAHVELCAERYNSVENKLSALDTKISHLCSQIEEVKNIFDTMSAKNNDRLISWGIGIIATLTLIIGFFLQHFIIK